MPDEQQFEQQFGQMLESGKKAAAALIGAGVPFLLGGGIASWARGGPPGDHDIDFFVKPADVNRARQVLDDAGLRTEDPPENWLVKAYDGDVMIDLIFEPAAGPVTDEVIERGDEMEVQALRMRVMTASDILVTKLLALREHYVDYDGVLEIARALREQIDWQDVKRLTEDSPFARAFFTLAEGLGIAPATEPQHA